MNVIDGGIQIPVEKEGAVIGLIRFNPDDIVFAERFYNLVSEFGEKEKEFAQREKDLAANAGKDDFGIPSNGAEYLAFAKEVCLFMREKIDELFGEGTSRMVFEEYNSPDMFGQFFEEIYPYIEQAREDKIKKYTGNRRERRAAGGKKVME